MGRRSLKLDGPAAADTNAAPRNGAAFALRPAGGCAVPARRWTLRLISGGVEVGMALGVEGSGGGVYVRGLVKKLRVNGGGKTEAGQEVEVGQESAPSSLVSVNSCTFHVCALSATREAGALCTPRQMCRLLLRLNGASSRRNMVDETLAIPRDRHGPADCCNPPATEDLP